MIKELLSLDDYDFDFYTEEKHGFTWYKIAIEGHIGFKSLKSFVDLYNTYAENLYEYLVSSDYKRKMKSESWELLYQRRAIEIFSSNDCYWIFLETFEDTCPWECYRYLREVIREIEEFYKIEKKNTCI